MALAIVLVAWAGVWLWMRGRILRSLDLAATQLETAGGSLTWSGRHVSGYPFRFDVDFTNLAWRGPDGWGLSTSRLKTETSVFTLGHWVAYAPAGASLLRPTGGEVRISARVLRASMSQASAHPPDVSVEGQGVSFTPAPGAQPYELASVAELHLHTRAGPADQGALLIELDGARAGSDGTLSTLAGDGAAAVSLVAIFDHADALVGHGWASMAKAWSDAGGRLQVRSLRFQVGSFSVEGRGTGLALGPDGRLAGTLSVAASGGRTFSGLGTLSFVDGRARLGSVDLGPSLRVY